jgi:hypothetical protein
MDRMIKLIGNHALFVEGVENRDELAQILTEIEDGSPVFKMFQGAGNITLQISEETALDIPYRHIRLNDPHVMIDHVIVGSDTEGVPGISIGLPDDAVRLHSAWVALNEGMPYRWDTFLKQYMGDLEKVASMMLDYVDTTRIDGLQGQVLTDPRLGENQVGLAPKTMAALRRKLMKKHKMLKLAMDIDGMWVLLERHPVAGPNGARWVQLVTLEDRDPGKIYVNALAWKEKHGGDEDGDGGYVGIGQKVEIENTDAVGAYPEVVITDGSDTMDQFEAKWQPIDNAADQTKVTMNAMTKHCTGPLTHMFHGVARTAAVRCARLGTTPEEQKLRFTRAYRNVFTINEPLTEAVMDGRKNVDALPKFEKVVDQLQAAVSGDLFDAPPFFPFIEETLHERLSGTFDLVGGTLASVRNTVMGKVIGAGDSGRERVAGKVIDDLDGLGILPSEMIRSLQACGLGEKILYVQPPKKNGKPRMEETLGLTISGEMKGAAGILECITYDGKPVFEVTKLEKTEYDHIVVTARFHPHWKAGAVHPVIQLLLPAIEKAGEDGHRVLNMPGIAARMYQPIFRLVDDVVTKVDVRLWLAEVLMASVEAFAKRMGKKVKAEKLVDHLDRALRSAVRELVHSTEQENLVRRAEFRVQITDSGTIKGNWACYERLLVQLAEMGYDVMTTSKNKPGEIVTKSWKYGLPRFLACVNPFAKYLDGKRRVEIREIRKALQLANPVPMPLKIEGTKVPDVLAPCLTLLNVMFADLDGLNVFRAGDGTFCFDTLLCSPSAMEKLALAKLKFPPFKEKTAADALVERLIEDGTPEDRISLIECEAANSEGLRTVAFYVEVEGPIQDVGKIKAAVGPIKGVMNVMPTQLYAINPDGSRTEIDLVVPRDTADRKNAGDARLTQDAIKGGITIVDPTMDLAEHRKIVGDALEAKGYNRDGTQTIVAVYADGTEAVVGEAVVGPLPFYRPSQTGESTFDIRTGQGGVKVQLHAMIMAQRVVDGKVVDEIRFNTPEWVHQDFAQVVECRSKVRQLQVFLSEGQESETPYADAVVA